VLLTLSAPLSSSEDHSCDILGEVEYPLASAWQAEQVLRAAAHSRRFLA
jgi:hypothetical protein